ncbi:MAG: carbohydrate kinase family protein [Candidatus Bathyarchaeia archaeon]
MLITTCGVAVADIIAADLPRVANPGEVIFSPKGNAISVGGHACNVPIDLIQMGLKKDEVCTIISIGDDPLGRFLIQKLQGLGLKVHALISSRFTSSNLILVVKGEDRRFHIDAGANLDLNPDNVLNIIREEPPRIFYVGAAGMLGRFDISLPEIYMKAKRLGCLTFTSIVEPYEKDWDFIIPALEFLDIFHANDREALQVTGFSDPVKAARSLIKHGVKIPIITLGERGLYTIISNQILKMPSFHVQCIDPTGAGDAFCAGILFKLVKHPYMKILENRLAGLTLDDWRDILLYASACGASCCTALGTTTAVLPDKINSILSDQLGEFIEKIEIKKI